MSIYIKYDLNQCFIKYNSFEEINDYNKIVYIDCNNNAITLPILPKSLQYLICNDNKFIKIIKYKYLKTIIYM